MLYPSVSVYDINQAAANDHGNSDHHCDCLISLSTGIFCFADKGSCYDADHRQTAENESCKVRKVQHTVTTGCCARPQEREQRTHILYTDAKSSGFVLHMDTSSLFSLAPFGHPTQYYDCLHNPLDHWHRCLPSVRGARVQVMPCTL